MNEDRPDISVVVIVYNDEARLDTAVRSVLEQTLRNVEVVIVDDRSTDRSYEVAQGLAARHPARVRAHRLDENSGGCGAPRNHGIDQARGTYVLFLDSDDVLERNACRNMLEAAETTGADLVSGLCVRVHVDSRGGKEVKWYPWLYNRTRTLESISELPDLLVFDTLSTNKCYRREFLVREGLRFPVGIHYEDLLFSAQAYAAARRITLIPNRVYDWRVVDNAAAKSISNRRAEIANFAHRMEIHRRVDRMLADRGLAELTFFKDVKFLKHDLVLHLRDLPFRDAAYRQEFAAIARCYLESIDRAAFDEAEPIHAICAYLLGRSDWDNLLLAVDTLTNRDKISSPLVERDGRVYWCAEHIDDDSSASSDSGETGDSGEAAFARHVLDVTELGYHTKPVEKMFLRNVLTGYEEIAGTGRRGGTGGRGGTVRLAGRITNPLGVVPPGARLTGELEFGARRKGVRFQTFRFPVRTLRHEGEFIAWEATVDLTHGLRPLGVVDAVWDVRLRLGVDGVRTTTRLTASEPGLAVGRSPVRPRLTRLVADHIEPEVSARGHLSFRVVTRERVEALVGRGVRGTPGRLAKSGYRKARTVRKKLTSGPTKIRIYHEVFSRLPVKKGLVVFESHLGRQYSDSPRALYEEMRRQDLDFDAVWSYAGGTPAGFPPDATLVRRWSLPYLKALAGAEFWVDNQSYPLKLTKRPQTTYLQTWHGSALKRMGFDEAEWKLRTRGAQEQQQRVLDRFDRFLIRSEHDVRTLARAFRLKERTLLRVGYPRNDALVAARRREEETGQRERGALAAELGIPDDRAVLLYAPTFRQHGGRQRRFELPFDVERFADEFGDRYVLLVRSHYLNHVVLPPSVRGRVVDVSAHHDVTPLLALADGLITDYSSVMFDYALLGRPMFFFAYDYEEYVHEGRGTYFDLRERAPGPVVRTEDELYVALASLDEQVVKYREAREGFVAEFGEYDTGTAARSIVDQFFAQWRRA
ncbi:bifunctional glycosyltransferase/CDP-glycerol:glycerophosphate glycerophosphotransferase [Streptomyces kroppenstedtii]|uniref:bifunctional glycosyltransferase/CDP-glycerol:glycerophosphate glycerophosphotransferase n=1 Tax=Streptomyces kroppenstedtii TaxID=3051181 RepID=UPI0028D4FA69|nr:bifunctional glycosyltransferase family 2 protein/CDP-glycerol:glycerophosphate glycerophosphotransferase [Streptomyces sp. DSM 40484]